MKKLWVLALVCASCAQPLTRFLVDAGSDAGPCPSGERICGSSCSNILLDDSNCGACGHTCGAAESCADGTCTDVKCQGVTCPAGQTCLLGTCSGGDAGVDGGIGDGGMNDAGTGDGGTDAGVIDGGCPNTPNSCGGCGHVCPLPQNASATCSDAGVCGRGPCIAGAFDFDPGSFGCETTCVGLTCTLGDGGVVVVTNPPLPETGVVFDAFASGSSYGAQVQTSSAHTNLGVLGEPTPPGGEQTSSTHRNQGGFSRR